MGATNRIQMIGLAELRAALRQLPESMTDEAQDIVDDATEVTGARLKQSYPLGDTGNLRAGVTTATSRESRFGVSGIVRSRSPHAHLWEFGTQSRKTRKGWNRGKGKEHTQQGLVPIAQQERRRMNQRLMDLVRRAGFQVSGDLG